MSIEEVVNSELFNTISNIDFNIDMYSNFTIIGLGAGILNGLSYEPIEGNVTVLAPSKEFDKFNSGYTRHIFIEGYDTSIGFDNSNVASPERTICDYIMYKNILDYYEVFEFVEFYGEENDWDFSKLYSMAESLGIDNVAVDSLVNQVIDSSGN